MVLSIFFLVAGLVLILFGANWLTDGASAVARRMGVSDLIIGLTVVAFGTSAPELVISLLSAIEGSSELAVGNAVGSSIFNVLVIIGVTAMVRPMPVSRSIMTNEIPLMLLASLVILAMGNGPLLGESGAATLSRVDGIVLLLFFAVFMRYTFAQAKSMPNPSQQPEAVEGKKMPTWRAILFIVVGLAELIFGGEMFVDGASDLARAFGVSDAVIGLTIVACGTSLPELATSIAAALKGSPGIAIGNVIGSNIFNIFFVLGLSATVTPLPLGTIGNVDLLTLVGASLLFWLFGWKFAKQTITRVEGGILTAAYIAYVAYLII